MKVYIASERKPKVDAVKTVFSRFSETLCRGESIEFIARSVTTSVPDMPLSTAELMQGAYLRAQNLMKLTEVASAADVYFIGLEGGFFSQAFGDRPVEYFLQSWAYAGTRARGYFGASGAVRAPDAVKKEVVDRGRELGNVIEDFASESDIRNKGGAFSVFTRGAWTRKAIFETALTYALAPFYNESLYRDEPLPQLNRNRQACSE